MKFSHDNNIFCVARSEKVPKVNTYACQKKKKNFFVPTFNTRSYNFNVTNVIIYSPGVNENKRKIK